MNFKKLSSIVLALSLALSLAVPAFAADVAVDSDTGLYGGTVEVTGTVSSPTITVTIPDSGTVVVNPYKMSVNNGTEDVTDQIVSATQYIVSTSNVPLSVSATVTGVLGDNSKAVFATKSAATATTKSVFMYFEILPTTAADAEPTWATAYDSKAASQILVAAKAATKANVVTLTDKDGTAPAAAYHLAGDAASNSTVAWSDDDAFDVTLAFTFTPTAVAAAST